MQSFQCIFKTYYKNIHAISCSPVWMRSVTALSSLSANYLYFFIHYFPDFVGFCADVQKCYSQVMTACAAHGQGAFIESVAVTLADE